MRTLAKAIEKGFRPGGDLNTELRPFRDYVVSTREDGEAICAALRRIRPTLGVKPRTFRVSSDLHDLTALFQQVDSSDSAAFEVLAAHGIPELCGIFDERHAEARDRERDDLMFVLKILAMYGTLGGTQRVIDAVRKPFNPDGYMWSVILNSYGKNHPYASMVFDRLREPLPDGFLAIALLDAANALLIDGGQIPHPFDSPEGKRRLELWLSSTNPSEYSYAHSATAALAFISNPERDQLLALAMDHAETSVQMEAAWASAKLGSKAGLRYLARCCLDPKHARAAMRYLEELGQEQEIPEEARDPGFQALAEFAHWLAHPNELGRPPDELEIIDRRELAWPPAGEVKPFWLIKYLVRDTTGFEQDDIECGVVGSVTFCLFSYKLAQRPPEDGYAIHCCWEMEGQGLIDSIDDPEQLEEYRELLNQWRGRPLKDAKILRAMKLAPELKYPQDLVVLASATLDGNPGWAVLDGPRSAWYPKSEMPEDVHDSVVLKVHVGRQLLGFRETPDRRKFLIQAPRQIDDRRLIDVYEKLLETVLSPPHRESITEETYGLLRVHFTQYVTAAAKMTNKSPEETTIDVYEKLFAAAQVAPDDYRAKAFDNFGPLGEHLEAYVAAVIATGRQSRVDGLVRALRPFWQHNLGYGKLGNAAFHCGFWDLAEEFCTKLRSSYPDSHRSEEMSFLAEIWFKKGKRDEARNLLMDCLRKLVAERRKATEDKLLFEERFQKHRATYRRLFPESADADFAKEGVPQSILHI